ncbi:MAG: rhomboid family intramembrane serine protease [Gammaproteobacteria bacterium]|jgi:membrane associated rhomboid family serine protease|nr:rhomboid family intramembrane serine protease [Gammaproteobacteria bacterium]MCW8941657.1 rhomboid family intramembrane serine protease [Gammaproteobacteria bacterium]
MRNRSALLEDPKNDRERLQRSFFIAAGFTALLWVIKLTEVTAGISLVKYGVYPGSLQGLPGIVFAPLIHSSFSHLFANTAPLLILGTALLYGYPRSARIVIPAVYLVTGLSVWLFGRQVWHIGASGLTFGFMFFVFTIGALRWDRKAIALSMIVFLLYGGMIWGVLPGRPGISFESHLSGAVIGLVLALLLRDADPRPSEKKYSWEHEDSEIPGLDTLIEEEGDR